MKPIQQQVGQLLRPGTIPSIVAVRGIAVQSRTHTEMLDLVVDVIRELDIWRIWQDCANTQYAMLESRIQR
jgi:hypothetical protein